MIHLTFTQKEINILVQAIRIANEALLEENHGRPHEIERLREKLQNVKD